MSTSERDSYVIMLSNVPPWRTGDVDVVKMLADRCHIEYTCVHHGGWFRRDYLIAGSGSRVAVLRWIETVRLHFRQRSSWYLRDDKE